MSEKERWLSTPLSLLEEEYPRFRDFSVFLGMGKEKEGRNITAFLDDLGAKNWKREVWIEKGHWRIFFFFWKTWPRSGKGTIPYWELTVREDSIKGKAGKPVPVRKTGEIITIVGPTGSGKSRLLGDIECLARVTRPRGERSY